jgi:hypothetical protein
MLGPNVFLSSCNRRELARRRANRRPPAQLALIVAVLAIAVMAFALGHGGI